ncbi:hypothetical protein CHGG_05637 [Chaetomium globosum CBS 148.51]|uniref:Uncharacterized protein n=1 Tax=Chaetomium globosum (strain ATCC 6205 / CBS 148.51 / DSM 1962 / NBRC 6347 / NRRL 1970) TaxID=306901 RepID=Q2H6S8_CHAGB|nr:uncharacterized protein CHGG_05637 [Chaetomium globosum CBS 148.51]EAQ89018.1 hypothetical protein CHGG_05637 [Chaetomium globosum CBS 148.51]
MMLVPFCLMVLLEDKLPLSRESHPDTTLLGTGVAHTLVGMRTNRVHTFFRSVFLTALGTAVLILYLMTPPLEPWRLVQNRSNESKGKTSDDELGLSDEEDNLGRQVEEWPTVSARELSACGRRGLSQHSTGQELIIEHRKIPGRCFEYDIVELQQTAETGAPPPAAPEISTAGSNHPQHITFKSISLSDSEMTMSNPASGSQPEPKPHHHSVVPAPLKRSSTRFPIESAVERHGDSRRNSALQQETAQTQPAGTSGHRRSTSSSSMPPHDLPHKVYPQTKHLNLMIGMREKLLRSRASGILTPTSGNAFHAPPDPSTGHCMPANTNGAHNHPVRSPTPSSQHRSSPNTRSSGHADLDDLPLSQRRSIIRHRQSKAPTNLRPTAHSTTFDSHQPRRGTSAMPTAIRHAQLASFRNSVAVDLRPSSPPSASDLRRMSSSATLHGGSNSNSLHHAAALGVAGVRTPTPTVDKSKTDSCAASSCSGGICWWRRRRTRRGARRRPWAGFSIRGILRS